MSWFQLMGGLLDGVSKIRQGSVDAKDARVDAQKKEIGARAEIDAAAQDELVQRTEARKFLSRQSAAYDQSGVLGVSPDAVKRQSAIDAEFDALNTRYQGQLRGWALREGLQSELDAGKAARAQKSLSGAASILQGFADYRGSK